VKVLVVGPGRAGCHLALLHKIAGDQVTLLGRGHGTWRNWARQHQIATSLNPARACVNAQQIIFAVSDDQLEAAVQQIYKVRKGNQQRLIVHLSGSHDLQVLNDFAKRGEYVAAVHPIYSFQKLKESPQVKLGGAAATLLLGHKAQRKVNALVAKWGAKPVVLSNSCSRSRYHLALTLASNHITTTFGRATEILGDSLGEQGVEVLASLAVQSILACAESGAAEALTGPIARCDSQTISRHLSELSSKELSRITPMLENVIDFALDSKRISQKSSKRLKQQLNQK